MLMTLYYGAIVLISQSCWREQRSTKLFKHRSHWLALAYRLQTPYFHEIINISFRRTRIYIGSLTHHLQPITVERLNATRLSKQAVSRSIPPAVRLRILPSRV